MNPKCKICGKELNKKEAYKVIIKGKNNYYCSKEEYDKMIEENSKRDMIQKQIETDLRIFSVTNKRKISAFILEMRKQYSYENILSYLRSGSQELEYAKNKNNYNNEMHKTSYYLVVIRNGIKEYIDAINKQKESVVETEFYMVPDTYKLKKRRRAMSQLEILGDDYE